MLNKPLCCLQVSGERSFKTFPYLTVTSRRSSPDHCKRCPDMEKKNKIKELESHSLFRDSCLSNVIYFSECAPCYPCMGGKSVKNLELRSHPTERFVMLGDWGGGDSSELSHSPLGCR